MTETSAAPVTCHNLLVTDAPSPSTPPTRGKEFRGKRAASNSLIVAVGLVTVLLISLVTTPIAINHIGTAEFAAWTLATTTIGILTALDPGFSNMVTRYGAQAKVRGETHVAARICAAGSLAWLGFGLVFALPVYFFVPYLVDSLDLNPGVRSIASTFFYWSFGLVIFSSLLSTLSSRLSAVGDQWIVTTIDVVTRVIYAVTLIELLSHGWRLSAIALATTVQFVLAYLATFVLIAVRQGRPYANPRGLDRSELREISRFGGWLQVNSVLDTLTNETDTLVLSFALGKEAVAIWGLSNRLARQITTFAYIPQQNILPVMSASFAALEGVDRMRKLYRRAQQIIVLLGAFLTGTIIAFGPLMFKAWLGQPHRQADVATILVALTLMAGLPRPATANAILALGRAGYGVPATILAFSVNVVFTVILVWPFGLNGVLIGTLLAKIAATSYLLHRFCTLVESSFREIILPWLLPLVGVTAVAAGLGRFAMSQWPQALHTRSGALEALMVLGAGYSVVYLVGLKLTRYFTHHDLLWIKSTAPGPLGKVISPRVVAVLGHGPA